MATHESYYLQLKDKWTDRHREIQRSLLEKHNEALDWLGKASKQLAVGSLSSFLLFAAPLNFQKLSPVFPTPPDPAIAAPIDKRMFLINDLKQVLPNHVQPLSPDEERQILTVLSRSFGLSLAAELENKRLERNYGLIGAEQHLTRYPGDSLNSHFRDENEAALFGQSGMAPGLGAWGYFTSSFDSLTEKEKEREKYYIAVQTFLSKDFNSRFAEYRDFYKYRKMLLVNPQNGKAIVTDIADAGPGESTGKHLGGSPEVMRYLQRFDGADKGPVLFFFVDDPNDSIPLGPVNEVQS